MGLRAPSCGVEAGLAGETQALFDKRMKPFSLSVAGQGGLKTKLSNWGVILGQSDLSDQTPQPSQEVSELWSIVAAEHTWACPSPSVLSLLATPRTRRLEYTRRGPFPRCSQQQHHNGHFTVSCLSGTFPTPAAPVPAVALRGGLHLCFAVKSSLLLLRASVFSSVKQA